MKTTNVLSMLFCVFLLVDITLSEKKMKMKTTTKAKLLSTIKKTKAKMKDTISAGCIRMYNDCNYSGSYLDLCNSVSSIGSTYNDRISSIKLGSNTVAYLYQDSNYNGEAIVINSDTSCLTGYSFNDLISSVKIQPDPGCVWLYKDCDYSGTIYSYCNDSSFVGDSFNDEASSVKLGFGTTVKLYKDSNYGGSSVSLSSNTSCLTSNSFNDETSSLKITKSTPSSGCAFLYTDCWYSGTKYEVCSDGNTSNYNDMISSIRLGPNTKITLYADSNYSGISVEVTADNPCLVKNNFNDSVSSYKLGTLSGDTEKIEAAAQRLTPTFLLHPSEGYFPTSIEKVSLNWSGISLTDTNETIYVNPDAQNSYDKYAPVYTKVKKQTYGGYKFIYAIFFAFNNCGPKLYYNAYAEALVTVGFKDYVKTSPCPAGKHNGDIEHAIVYTDKNFNPYSVEIAYHSWSKTYDVDELTWDGNHVKVYIANGSHGMYPSATDNYYLVLWDESSSEKFTFLDVCYYYGVPYPCTSTYTATASTYGSFVDFTSSSGSAWRPFIRLLASDAHTITTSLTTNETNILQYQGRFGEKYENNTWNDFKTTIEDACDVISSFCSNCASSIEEGLDSADSEMQSDAPTSLATKGWWKS